MFEIGDDLPTLGSSAERLSLVSNADLLDVARLGRAATPIDLLSYDARDLQPSIFLLPENHRQALLTIFNWSEEPRARVLDLAKLGLRGHYRAAEVFGAEDCCELASGTIKLTQKPQSVRIIKLVEDKDDAPLAVEVRGPTRVTAGDAALFEVQAGSEEQPVLNAHWTFGDGTSADGMRVQHAYTASGDYEVAVSATGLGSLTSSKAQKVVVDGTISTRFEPSRNKRADGVEGR
jgi:hypothetical protein